jgi:hypothetical protein
LGGRIGEDVECRYFLGAGAPEAVKKEDGKGTMGG